MKEIKRMRKGIVFGLLFVLLAAMVVITVPMNVSAVGPYYVEPEPNGSDSTGTGTSGAPWASIEHALDNVIAWDVINVRPGTYPENPVIDTQGITLQSTAGAATTIINGDGSGDVVTISNIDVTITGFTIQNSGDIGSDAGIKIEAGSSMLDCTIDYCIITDNINGISLVDTKRCPINNNEIYDNYRGIYMTNCDGSTGSNGDGNIIQFNEIYSGDLGIFLDNSDYQQILDNDRDLNSDDNYGIHDLETYGIWLQEDSNYNFIERNIIESNSIGMTLLGSDYNKIKENVIEDSYSRGIDIAGDCGSNEIYYNNFYDNNGATSSYDVNHIQAQDGSNNNNWYDGGTDGNYWSDWTFPDGNSDGIVDDPYILEVENQDPFPLVDPY